MIVIDNSALVAWLTQSDKGDAVAARLRGRRLHAPAVIDLEFASALKGLVKGKALTLAEAEGALHKVAHGLHPIARIKHEPLLSRVWELRHNCSPYDAAYVAAAESLGTTLLTCDGGLARAPGVRCPIELVS